MHVVVTGGAGFIGSHIADGYVARGWDVTVLTPENPSVPVIDRSLEREIPAETVLLRPRTIPSVLALCSPNGSKPFRIGLLAVNCSRVWPALTAARVWSSSAVR